LMLRLLLLCCAGVLAVRDVMIWSECNNNTIEGLRQVRHSFTKFAPFNAGIRRYPDGSVGISINDGFKTCGEMIHTLPDDPLTGRRVEYWPCVGASGDTDAAMLRSAFANSTRFIQDAVEMAKAFDIQGWNLDFEATGQAPNVNHSFWLETLQFYDMFARELHKHGVKTTVDVMCAANVTSPFLCKNGLPFFNESSSSAEVDAMRSSAVDRFVSMGTYGLDLPTTINQMDWFVANVGKDKYGLGTASVPTVKGGAGDVPGTDSEILSRFAVANAYDVGELDIFDYAASSPTYNFTKPYWKYLERWLHYGSSEYPAGQAWPYA